MLGIDDYTSFDQGLSYLTGCSDLHPRTMRYMMRPHSQITSDFMKFYDETIESIKKYMHTKADLMPIVGPGRAAMDMVLNSFCEHGDKVLFIDNGYWGRYPAQVMAPYYKIRPILLTFDVHRQMDLGAIEKKLKEEKPLKAVHMIHVETEIGAINPVKQVGDLIKQYSSDTLLIVDSASAFPGNPLETDKWGIDVDYFVSHKGFNSPSGLNFVSINKKAWSVFDKRKSLPNSWYTSIGAWKDIWVDCPNDSRHCPESFPAVIFEAMRAKIDMMNSMGEEKYLKKYEIASRAIREGLRKMTEPQDSLVLRGPKCKNCPGCDAADPNLSSSIEDSRLCSQTMFGVRYPFKPFPIQKFREVLENDLWWYIAHQGFGDDRKDGYFYSANGLRIGIIREDQHYPRNIVSMLFCVGYALRKCGVKAVSQIQKGVETAIEVMKEYRDIGYQMYQSPP